MESVFKKEYIENDESFCFETTSLVKIFALSFLTDGLYLVVLSFSYWKRLKDNFGHKVSPFWRAIFIGFSNFPLFQILNKYLKHFDCKGFNAPILAITFFFINAAVNRMAFMSLEQESINWGYEAANLILTMMLTSIIAFVQSQINAINKERFINAPVNKWTKANTIWSIISFVFIIFYYFA